MKKMLLLFIVVFAYCSSNAQRWELFKNDISHYTTPQPNTSMGISIYTDSFALTLQVDTTITHSNKKKTIFVRDYSGRIDVMNNICVGSSASIMGDSLVEMVDSSIYYINNNQLIWKNTNQWTCFRDSNNNELVITLDSTSFLNGDSLKYYSFSSANSSAFDSTLYTLPFIVSKLNGMEKGFDLSYFATEIKPVSFFLNGLVKNSHIYDYEIGDEFHYEHRTDYGYFRPSYDLYILRVIGKMVHNQDSVSYTFERKVRDDQIIFVSQGYYHQNNNFQDTIIRTYSLQEQIHMGVYMDVRFMATIPLYPDTIGIYNSDFGLLLMWDLQDLENTMEYYVTLLLSWSNIQLMYLVSENFTIIQLVILLLGRIIMKN